MANNNRSRDAGRSVSRVGKRSGWGRASTGANGPVKVIKAATVDGERYAPHWLRMRVLKRDGFKCRHCGRPVTNETANMDHVIPWKRGGKTVKSNLVTSCRECNKSKGNEYWFPSGQRRPTD